MQVLVFLLMLPVGSQLQPNDQGAALLTRAARLGDIKEVELLLASGADPNAHDGYGLPALQYAASFNRAEVAAALLKNGADPNELRVLPPHQSSDPATALQYAADRGNAQITSLLIASGAKVNAVGQTGRTALHFAANRGYPNVIRLLLEAKADPNVRDLDGSSPLDEAIYSGSPLTVAMLLKFGARLNAQQTKTGATPLNEAAFIGNTTMVRYLVDSRADVSIADKHGYDPLENSVRMKKEDSALLLLRAETQRKRDKDYYAHILAEAIKAEQPGIVKALLKDGVAVNAPMSSGFTPLSLAAANGFTQGVQILLAGGADPKLVDANGATPLQDASLKGSAETVQLLLDGDAPINTADRTSGATPLYAAASFGRTEAAALLLDRGADPNICTNDRRSPYRAASENGFAEIAHQIASHGGRESCENPKAHGSNSPLKPR